MTYDQYWYGDTWMVRAFREADRLRQKRKNDEAWLFGAYVRYAIDSTICNAFRKEGTQPVRYPDGPIEKPESGNPEEDSDVVFAKAYMEQMMRAGKNWGMNHGS